MNKIGEDDDNEFVVETILEKLISRQGKEKFLVKWEGYENEEDRTWEPISHLEKHMIADFEKNEENIKKKIVEAEKSGLKRRSVRFSMENTETEKDPNPKNDIRKSSRKQVSWFQITKAK